MWGGRGRESVSELATMESFSPPEQQHSNVTTQSNAYNGKTMPWWRSLNYQQCPHSFIEQLTDKNLVQSANWFMRSQQLCVCIFGHIELGQLTQIKRDNIDESIIQRLF